MQLGMDIRRLFNLFPVRNVNHNTPNLDNLTKRGTTGRLERLRLAGIATRRNRHLEGARTIHATLEVTRRTKLTGKNNVGARQTATVRRHQRGPLANVIQIVRVIRLVNKRTLRCHHRRLSLAGRANPIKLKYPNVLVNNSVLRHHHTNRNARALLMNRNIRNRITVRLRVRTTRLVGRRDRALTKGRRVIIH